MANLYCEEVTMQTEVSIITNELSKCHNHQYFIRTTFKPLKAMNTSVRNWTSHALVKKVCYTHHPWKLEQPCLHCYQTAATPELSHYCFCLEQLIGLHWSGRKKQEYSNTWVHHTPLDSKVPLCQEIFIYMPVIHDMLTGTQQCICMK